ncbi:hypothetical protein DXG03_005137 [Asterophora parasitica]|uniref:YMC020W-like alpha/beta hydrolase domain-containing protein n=1 Tax=Asterophora parasitica TaxID=117018 RepID=A0A9P7KA07_9AGAR|nr:hypothetical protein DXG03_005137 [Asterophora parasitica]
MPSSSRSSRSTASRSPLKPPAWRTNTLSKSSPGLSYVFAEPEQGSPLAPASSTLPIPNLSGSLENIDAENPLPRLGSRMQSMESIGRGPQQAVAEDVVRDSQAETSSVAHVSAAQQTGNAGDSIPLPQETTRDAPVTGSTSSTSTETALAPASNPDSFTTPLAVVFPVKSHEPAPTKSSWFGRKAKTKHTNLRDSSAPLQAPAASTEITKAVSQLPKFDTEAQATSPSASISLDPGHAHRIAANDVSQGQLNGAVADSSLSINTGTNVLSPPRTDAQHSSITAPPPPIINVIHSDSPPAVPSPIVSPEPAPTRSSWFGSLSRTSGKGKAQLNPRTASAPLQAPVASTGAPIPTVPSPLSMPDPAPTSPAPAPVPASSIPPPAISLDGNPTTPIPTPISAPAAIPDTVPSPPRDILAPQPASWSWFSSSTSTSFSPTPHPVDTHPSNSIPSSIDEEVPRLVSVTPPRLASPGVVTSPSSEGGTGRQRVTSLSSLNPSTSRFVLSIPLLGRVKVPLDRAVVGAGEEKEEVIQAPKDSEEGLATATVSVAQVPIPIIAITPDTPSIAPPPPPAPSDQPTSSDTQSASDTAPVESAPIPPSTSAAQPSIESSSSWWSYVGWGASPSPSTVTLAKEDKEDAKESPDPEREKHVNPAAGGSDVTAALTTATTTMSVTTDVKATTLPAAPPMSTTPSSSTKSAGTVRPGVPNISITAASKSNPPYESQVNPQSTHPTEDVSTSVTGAAASITATESQVQGAWYSPWAWYGTGTASTSDVAAAAAVDAPNRHGDAPGEGAQLTQAEMVKEAALARGKRKAGEEGDGESEVKKSKKEDEAAKEGEDVVDTVNPVADSIVTNRSAWTYLFSSPSLMRKTITAAPESEPVQRDENGMEVMDIDDEEEASTAVIEVLPVPVQERGRDAGKAKAIGGDVGTLTKLVAGKHAASKVSAAAGPSTSKKDKSSSRSSSTKPEVALSRSPAPSIATTKGLSKPAAPPLTISESAKRETVKPGSSGTKSKPAPPPLTTTSTEKKSPAPSLKSASGTNTPGGLRASTPNLILPTWDDTFHTSPRSVVPPPPTSKFSKTMRFVSDVLFAADKDGAGDAKAGKGKGKGKALEREREKEFMHFGKELPRAYHVVEKGRLDEDVLRGCRRVVVIGIHGWFPGALRFLPTGTSGKFVNMMVQALEEFQEQNGVKLEKITKVPLEGEGTIEGRVAKLYANLQANQEWMGDLHAADAILVATHSQGSIVSTHLLDRLIRDHHIRTARNTVVTGAAASFPEGSLTLVPAPKPQRVCCLALCGIHLGPLRYLSSSSLLQPYFQYFESAAARELFEFQNTESEVSKNYVAALRSVVDHGTKIVYVASLNDQVVPIYSGLFTAVSHPLILRALYIDGDAYHSSDFLSNLLVLLLRIQNSGISDSGLTVHLSEATAGSLSGVGHSTAYEEISTYSLAVKYLFLTNDGLEDQRSDLVLEPFNATTEQNDYEIPWSLRDVIADERVAHLFSQEIAELRDAFRDWHPKTSILRDLKRKLQPIQRLPSSFSSPSSSKL